MNTANITTRNYRTYLLNQAAKTGDHALANLAKTAMPNTLNNLFRSGYKLPVNINYDALRAAITANKANGDDMGSNDGVNWAIATGNNNSYEIVIHVNFNGTLCRPVYPKQAIKG